MLALQPDEEAGGAAGDLIRHFSLVLGQENELNDRALGPGSTNGTGSQELSPTIYRENGTDFPLFCHRESKARVKHEMQE